MLKTIRYAVIGICAFMLLFTFIPTGAVSEDYRGTLSYASSDTLSYTYTTLTPTDPLLEEVAEESGDHVDYIWVDSAGASIPYVKTSTFPQRNGDLSVSTDYAPSTSSSQFHRGTDYGARGAYDIAYQVSLWGGTVIAAQYNSSWGNYVVVQHTDHFYTRYAHMANDSLCVQVGDTITAGTKIGVLGSTGNSTGPHAHIELILCPVGSPADGTPTASFYYAGVDNILRGGKTLDELTWYKFTSDRTQIIDQSAWDALVTS